MSKERRTFITEQILEIRHAAVGKFLDIRGTIADHIKKSGHFKHWSIQENIIVFSDEAEVITKPKALVSYKKIAFIVSNASTKNFFQDKAAAFLKELNKIQGYTIPEIERLGTRTKCFIPANNLTFSGIYQNICKKFFNNGVLSELGNKSSDLQLVLDMEEQSYKARLILGPVKENEALKYFSFESKDFVYPGLYIDIDYFKIKDISQKDIKKLLTKAIKLTWEKIETTANITGI